MANPPPPLPALRLKTLGAPLLERDGRPLEGAATQRRVVALLTLLAVAGERGISRDSVLAVLWPEADPEKARQALTQALYHARRVVKQDELFIASADLRLNPEVISTDLWEFEEAVAKNELERAEGLHEGPFLDGFHVNGAPEFERWAGQERSRLTQRRGEVLERLAGAAESRKDYRTAVTWRRKRAALDPLNSQWTVQLMLALAAAGDRAGALQQARIHEELLRRDLDVVPDPGVTSLVERLRNDASLVPSPGESPPSLPNEDRAAARPREPEAAPVIEPRTPGPEPAWWRQRRFALAAGGLAMAAVIVLAALRIARSPGAARIDPNKVMVAPFRVSGADRALTYLREGLVDLLTTKLTEDIAVGATDAGSVMAAWRRAGLAEDAGVPREVAFGIARELGASRLLLGSVVGTPRRVVISATLLAVADGALRAQATVEGSTDSLTSLVDGLVARLLATEAGAWERLARHTSTSAQALRAYLDGQSAHRRGSYREAIRHFRLALERDLSFAMAGLGLASAAERVDAVDDVARGLAAAWGAREELIERDRIYLEALAGPRYPAPSSARELLTAWERVAGASPDRADVWQKLGERLFHDGMVLGIRDWQERATLAFQRATSLDPAFASPQQFLVQLTARGGDTLAVRRLATSYLRTDSVGELASFVRWRSAVALSDSASLRVLRRAMPSLPSTSLRTIVLSSQFNGLPTRDAQRAIAILRSRAVSVADRGKWLLAEHALALNRGELEHAARVIDQLEDVLPLSPLPERSRLLDAQYGGADSIAGSRSADRLAQREDAEDRCLAAQWRAWRGQAPLAAAASGTAADGITTVCGALVDAIAAVRGGASDAVSRVARADSLLAFGPPVESMRDYANVAVSRLYFTLGDARRALAAVRRRPHMREWPHYLAPQLRDEGRYAELVGDRAGAIEAYRHYLLLRENPDRALADEVQAVRSALARLAPGVSH
jgi:DNA-binding SARP family transcriptional activator